VDGLDEVACPPGADVGDTGTIVDLGGHLAHQALDRVVGGTGATGHHAGPFQGAFGATGDPHTDVAEALALELGDPAFGIRIEGIAAVDQQITLLEQRCDLLDHGVDWIAGLDHHQDPTGSLELGDEVGEARGADDALAGTATSQKLLGPGVGAVVDDAGKTVALSVEDKVLAHHAEADQAEVSLLRGCSHATNAMRSDSVWPRSGDPAARRADL